jgi:hypothetical protein
MVTIEPNIDIDLGVAVDFMPVKGRSIEGSLMMRMSCGELPSSQCLPLRGNVGTLIEMCERMRVCFNNNLEQLNKC